MGAAMVMGARLLPGNVTLKILPDTLGLLALLFQYLLTACVAVTVAGERMFPCRVASLDPSRLSAPSEIEAVSTERPPFGRSPLLQR